MDVSGMQALAAVSPLNLIGCPEVCGFALTVRSVWLVIERLVY